MILLNPYKWNQVHLDLFYGREPILRDIMSGMLNGHSFALMGGRRMGKTTLLRKIESEIQSHHISLLNGGLMVIPIYVDVLSFADLSSPDTISQRILKTISEFLDRDTPPESNSNTPYTFSNPLANTLSSFLTCSPDHRIQIMFLFDEMNPIINSSWGSTYLGNWRALLHNSPPISNHISAVFAGAHEIVSLAHDVSSPLANILSWKILHSFSKEDTRLLVEEPSAMDLPNNFYNKIFEITGGHPFLIQYLMSHVVRSDRENCYSVLEDACLYFLDNEFRQFQNWFSDFDELTQQVYEFLLSEGITRKQDLVRSFKDSGAQTQIQNCLNVLSSYGVVRQIDKKTYKISGELFKLWYIENHIGEVESPSRIISDAAVDPDFEEHWHTLLKKFGKYNILVEGKTDKMYMEIAVKRYKEVKGIDLLEGDKIHVIAGRGTKRIGQEFGILQSLESVRGIKYVVILDADQDGERAAEAMHGFGAQKNRHYFCLSRVDYRDKSGQSWDVEIEDMLPQSLIEQFVLQHPDAVEERLQRSNVSKYTIRGRPLKKNGQTYEFKEMLVEFVRQHATFEDLSLMIKVLKKARKCMGLKEEQTPSLSISRQENLTDQ